MLPILLFSSEARTASLNTGQIHNNGHHRGIKIYLDITAVSGTAPTLDVLIQSYDLTSAKWFSIPGAAFAQKTGTGQSTLTLYPSVGETANESVSDVLPNIWRVAATIGGTTPSFTFSLAGVLLP